jgi:hypothetical protein
MSSNGAAANNRLFGHKPSTRMGYPITPQHPQFKINQKPKEIKYNNSILFKFDDLSRPYKAEEIINELEKQLPSSVLDAMTAFRPIGSNKKWVIAFNNTIDAITLVDRTIEIYDSAVKLMDPNLDQSVKHAIIRIHWLPAEISDEDIKYYITRKFDSVKDIVINEETFSVTNNDRLSKLKSGIRRVKCQILRREEHKLAELVGKTVIEGHKALITVPGIKMCFKCLDLGHVKSECMAGDRCRTCRGFGHLSSNCSTANKIMAPTNVEKEQLSSELNTIDDSEDETNNEQPQAKLDKPNPFAPAQGLPVQPPPPPPLQSNTATTNERSKRNNRDISPGDSPTTNDLNPKMRAIEEKNGENGDEHEATDEDENNVDEDGFEDHENENNSPNHDELTIQSMRNEILTEKKSFKRLSQQQKKDLRKQQNANSNPNVS